MSANKIAVEAFTAVEEGSDFSTITRLTDDLFDASVARRAGGWPLVQMHPLGFLAIVWPIDQFQVLRLHYWSQSFDWAQSSDLEIHDHTFEFASAVLSGCIRNDIYSVRDSGQGYTLYLTSYAEGSSCLSPQQVRVAPVLESSHSYTAGALYRMPSGVLHRTVLESDAGITVLAARYHSVSRDGARVIGPVLDSAVVFERATFEEHQLTRVLSCVRSELNSVIGKGRN